MSKNSIAFTAWLLMTALVAYDIGYSHGKEEAGPTKALSSSRLDSILHRLDESRDKDVVLVIGDSIIQGFKHIEFPDYTAVNGGVGGRGIDYFVQNIDDMLRFKPKFVVVAIGINDCVLGRETDETHWRKGYELLIQKIRKTGSVPVIVTMLPIEYDQPLGTKYFNSVVQNERNSFLISLAKREGIHVIDAYQSFSGQDGYMPTGWTTDGVHPTPETYLKIRKLYADFFLTLKS